MSALCIGPHQLDNPLILAPMAGVTDWPFRRLCRRLGAAMAVSEMVTSDKRLWDTRKSRLRLPQAAETEPRSVQIAGADPQMLSEAARQNEALGAQIIDLNMGCPAKKVCNKAAGSALLRDEALVGRILEAVVAAVKVPVTLKIRTGWNASQRNAVTIARLAEGCGIAALAIHGRTRADAFKGEAEYRTIRQVRDAISIPLFANGDIDSAEKARQVLDETAADGLLIGRATLGNPWIFREIASYLASGQQLAPPSYQEMGQTVLEHVRALHDFYGPTMGVRIARKHVGWYVTSLPGGIAWRSQFNRLMEADSQIDAIAQLFGTLQGQTREAAPRKIA